MGFGDKQASNLRMELHLVHTTFPPPGEAQASHFSRDVSLRSAFLSPTIRIVTPVTLPTISA